MILTILMAMKMTMLMLMATTMSKASRKSYCYCVGEGVAVEAALLEDAEDKKDEIERGDDEEVVSLEAVARGCSC